jgi:hypothetical protein
VNPRSRYRCLLWSAGLLVGALFASCSVDQAENPAYTGCHDNDGCAPGERCRRGYCVPSSGGAASGASDESIESPLHGDRSAPMSSAPPADASTGSSSAGARAAAPDASQSKPGSKPGGSPAAGQGGSAGAGQSGSAGAGDPPPPEPPADQPVGACATGAQPAPESCNAEDDDCDGRSDELPVATCYPGTAGCSDPEADGTFACTGACKAGIRSCDQGSEACTGAVMPASAESCTERGAFAEDEDCDGRADEGCACGSDAQQTCFDGPRQAIGVGPCRSGTQTCANGAWSTCSGAHLPQAETCDRSDEDCDGEIDEGFMLETDAANCGRCGHACGEGQSCCAGNCIDTQREPAHCGACGHECTGLLQACCEGVCKTLCLL